MKRCLIVFAKEPEKEKVKTRLHKDYPKDFSLNLYKCFLKDTIDIAKRVRCEVRILAHRAETGKPLFLKKAAPSFLFYPQRGKDLGERMHNAFSFAKKLKSRATVIIGSDSPNLPQGFVQEAFEKLRAFDAVLGPSADGGYFLLGLRYPCPGAFEGIKWSSRDVLKTTISKLKKLKKKTALLREWYDVDEIKSLKRLQTDLNRKGPGGRARFTKRFLDE